MNPLRRRPHPVLLEIPVRPWLARLGADGPPRLDGVPDAELDRLAGLGLDAVWLMGVWTPGPRARAEALRGPGLLAAYEAALPGWTVDDVAGSPYAIARHEPDPALGGVAALAALRARLRERGLGLVLDFVPNHVGIDHPWLDERPDLLVAGTERDLARESANWFVHPGPDGARVLAHGRDPHFPGWSDTAQVDLRRRDARAAMGALLREAATLADGLRCDMAVLPLPDVLERTWGPGPAAEAGDFWAEAIGSLERAGPDCALIAEAYWGLEDRLAKAGFAWSYDKELLDRLVGGDVEAVRAHVAGPAKRHARRVHFLENHDESRAAASLGERWRAALAIAWGLPGMRFLFDGQLEGRRTRFPVQLARWSAVPPDEERAEFHRRLLAALDDDTLRSGEWAPAGVRDGGEGPAPIGSTWRTAGETVVVLGNPAAETSRHAVEVPLPSGVRGGKARDALGGESFEWSRKGIEEAGLVVEVPPGDARLIRLA